jgi:prepilin-type N-terminal cleavage/methylation domain-containing protein
MFIRYRQMRGFTLIELSIVLIIIGLIVGGILSGKTLIESAQIRAQITQINNYRLAVKAFQGKYNCLPGDCKNATQFGFTPGDNFPGNRDGNGVLQGIGASYNGDGTAQGHGESAVFWRDLSEAKMIDGSFNTAICTGYSYSVTCPSCTGVQSIAGDTIRKFYPPAKIGNGNYIYTFSGGLDAGEGTLGDGFNYFGIDLMNDVSYYWRASMMGGLTPIQAYQFDSKVDDGFPLSGTVRPMFIDLDVNYRQGTGTSAVGPVDSSTATNPTANTCYDNNNSAGQTQHYSTQMGNTKLNCSLAWKF